jgi:hypothetical protein
VFGLRTIQLARRRPAPTVAGMKRNAIFAVALLPAVFAAGAIGRYEALGTLAVVLALESAVALRPLARDVGQRRIGDLWAGTQVIDASIALQLPAPVAVPPERAFAQPPAVHQERPAARQRSAACASR